MENIKVYITKGCLETGKIAEASGYVDSDNKNQFLANNGIVYAKKDWSLTKEDASKVAKEKREKRIAHVTKCLAEIQNYDFDNF